jgi:hypothetical protein
VVVAALIYTAEDDGLTHRCNHPPAKRVSSWPTQTLDTLVCPICHHHETPNVT